MNCPVCGRHDIDGVQCPQCDADLSCLWTLHNSHLYYFNEGLRKFRDADTEGAIASFRTSLALNPDDLESRIALAKILLTSKKYRESRVCWSQVLENDPDNQTAKYAILKIERTLRRNTSFKYGLGILASLSFICLVAFLFLFVSKNNQLETIANRESSMNSALASRVNILVDSLQESKTINSSSGFTYKIRQGDSFWTIARRFYGRSGGWREIMNQNRHLKGGESRLKIGSVINLPNLPAADLKVTK
jgi:tetratricopeptide (TPR) repeat protein